MKALKSSNLAGYDYDAENRMLTIQFQNGGTYIYNGVEPEVAAGLGDASSPGSYFHQKIKGRYPYK